MKQCSFLFVLICILLNSVSCREKLPETYYFFPENKVNANYKLVIIPIGEGFNLISEFDNAYIDNPLIIGEVSKKWVFTKKSDVMPCGYEYSLILVDDSKIITEKYLNFDCGYLGGWIYFPKYYLLKYKSHFKKFSPEELYEFYDPYNP